MKLLWPVIGLLLLAFLFLTWRNAQTKPPPGIEISGTALVSDGDTLRIGAVKVRLYGIDAPEHDQTCTKGGKIYPCGKDAAVALTDLIRHQTVTCTKRDTDRYGRTVAVCYVGKVDLNAQMVQSGYALAYRQYSSDYVPQENAARQAKRGLHAGTYVEPWKYRKGERTPAMPGGPAASKVPNKVPSKPYPSCAAARAAGRTPVLRGEAGYNPKLDGDKDGKMCE